MRALLETMDIPEFEALFHAALAQFKTEEKFKNFGKYIEEHYADNRTAWTYCYKKNSKINTNNHIERMHRTIKYVYLKG